MEKKFEITAGFAAVVCLLAWMNLRLCLWFCVSALVHELGHGIAMLVCRVPIRRVSLRASGAVISGSFHGYGQEILCAAAGPAAGFLLMVGCCRCAPDLAIVSGLLGCVNLLPLYPLDGGRVLRAALLMKLEEGQVIRILSLVSFAVCCLLMVGACWLTVELQAGIWPIFAALVILCRVGNTKWTEQ